MTTRKCEVFHSSLTKKGWVVREGGETISLHHSQKEAEMAARLASRKVYLSGGTAQAVFHKVDGSVRERRTYGRDAEHQPA
jgi:Uncharacterized protein conserved in bacteria (DUF2188)